MSTLFLWGSVGVKWIKINDRGTSGSGNARESALAVCTEAYIGSRFESGRHTGRKHMEKHVLRDGQTSSSIFHADIDYWRRDDLLYFQVDHGHIVCRAASLYKFAYVADRDPRAVAKIQINTNKFY